MLFLFVCQLKQAQGLVEGYQALVQLQHHTVLTVLSNLWAAFLLSFQHAMRFRTVISAGENVLCQPNVYDRVGAYT